MKREDAVELILVLVNEALKKKPIIKRTFDFKDANAVLLKLEDLKIVDKSEFGAICSRCKSKGWAND